MEKFLQMKHAEDYGGTDDGMPDAFPSIDTICNEMEAFFIGLTKG
jgi:hypothetical protein